MSYQITEQDIKEAVVLPEWQRIGIRHEPCKGVLGWLGYYKQVKVSNHVQPIFEVHFPRLATNHNNNPPKSLALI